MADSDDDFLERFKHKRIWSQNLVGAVAFHALMTSLCPNGFNTGKTHQPKRLLNQVVFAKLSFNLTSTSTEAEFSLLSI